jgi:hypothetical protein
MMARKSEDIFGSGWSSVPELVPAPTRPLLFVFARHCKPFSLEYWGCATIPKIVQVPTEIVEAVSSADRVSGPVGQFKESIKEVGVTSGHRKHACAIAGMEFRSGVGRE